MSTQISEAVVTPTTTQINAGGKTGATIVQTGPYKCSVHTGFVLFFQKGDKFSICPVVDLQMSRTDGHNADWILVRETDILGAPETES